ncbi:odorant receptor 131-2-like [Centroberyx affinis]|uniref:odorant receptor 131-2-like n=1 Tax=Centroberyx affinis TaxID=166261 RepID=UPI003A5C0417
MVVYHNTFSTAVAKNVIVVALCISINSINGTLVNTFKKHQMLRVNPRYILFIHLVINDMILLTFFCLLHVISYILYTISVSFCIMLLLCAVFATVNMPINLALMAIECYIAICIPALSILPDVFVLLATEPLEFFHSKVFQSPHLIKKKEFTYIVFLVLVWLTLFYTYFRILFAAKAAAADAKKAKNTVLLHGFQLVLCMLTYVVPLMIKGLTLLFPEGSLVIRFTLSVFIQILPRLISPIVYGLRDNTFRKYLKKYFFCKECIRFQPQTTVKLPL